MSDLPSVKNDNVLVRSEYAKHKGYVEEEEYDLRNASYRDISKLMGGLALDA